LEIPPLSGSHWEAFGGEVKRSTSKNVLCGGSCHSLSRVAVIKQLQKSASSSCLVLSGRFHHALWLQRKTSSEKHFQRFCSLISEILSRLSMMVSVQSVHQWVAGSMSQKLDADVRFPCLGSELSLVSIYKINKMVSWDKINSEIMAGITWKLYTESISSFDKSHWVQGHYLIYKVTSCLTIHAKNVWCGGDGFFGKKKLAENLA